MEQYEIWRKRPEASAPFAVLQDPDQAARALRNAKLGNPPWYQWEIRREPTPGGFPELPDPSDDLSTFRRVHLEG